MTAVQNVSEICASLQAVDIKQQLSSCIASSVLAVIKDACDQASLVPMQELEVLGAVVRAIKPKMTFEVGLASGSTALTIMGAAGCGLVHHTALDPLQDVSYDEQAVKRVARAGLSDRFT